MLSDVVRQSKIDATIRPELPQSSVSAPEH